MMEYTPPPVLYFDTTLILHTLLDFILLQLTGKLCLLSYKKFYLLLASAAGGIFGTLCMMNYSDFFTSSWARLLFPLVMIQIALAPPAIKDWINSIGVFFLLNIIMTGILFLLFSMPVPGKILHQVVLWSAGIFILYGITRQFLRVIPKLSHQMTQVSVFIQIEQEKICCHGFVDTGNSLIDPAGGKPVIVCKKQLFQKVFPLEGISAGSGSFYEMISRNEVLQKRMTMIPYHCVGKNHGMMVGFRSDIVIIKNTLVTAKHKGIVIALTEENIPDCLVPAVLL